MLDNKTEAWERNEREYHMENQITALHPEHRDIKQRDQSDPSPLCAYRFGLVV